MAERNGVWHTSKSGTSYFQREGESQQKAAARKRGRLKKAAASKTRRAKKR